MTEVQTMMPEDCAFINVPHLIEKAKRLYAEHMKFKEIAASLDISTHYLRILLNKHEINLGQHNLNVVKYSVKSVEKTELVSKEIPKEKPVEKPIEPPKPESKPKEIPKPNPVNPITDEIRKQKYSPMKVVTINIPDQYLDCIESMVNMGFFPSRSETVREALKHFLMNEAELNQNLDAKEFCKLKRQQMESMLR